MTTPTIRGRPVLGRLVGHYLGIVVAAAVGMAVLGPAESMLLDNMDVDSLKRAVDIVDCAAFLEASGGITLESVSKVAATGIDAK